MFTSLPMSLVPLMKSDAALLVSEPLALVAVQ